MADVVGHKDEGTTRGYELSSDQAWELAKIVFRTEGADAIEEHRDEGYMLTSSGSNFYSKGAVMGAWVEPEVEVGSMSRCSPSAASKPTCSPR